MGELLSRRWTREGLFSQVFLQQLPCEEVGFCCNVSGRLSKGRKEALLGSAEDLGDSFSGDFSDVIELKEGELDGDIGEGLSREESRWGDARVVLVSSFGAWGLLPWLKVLMSEVLVADKLGEGRGESPSASCASRAVFEGANAPSESPFRMPPGASNPRGILLPLCMISCSEVHPLSSQVATAACDSLHISDVPPSPNPPAGRTGGPPFAIRHAPLLPRRT